MAQATQSRLMDRRATIAQCLRALAWMEHGDGPGALPTGRFRNAARWLAAFITAASCFSSTASEFIFSVVPQFDSREILQEWTPIMDELSRKTGHTFRLQIAPSISDFENAFEKGTYDFAFANPYHYLVANRVQGYVALVRDATPIHGIVVVAKDSPLRRVEELDGKVVAFPAPNALGAALIPRAEFARRFRISITARYVKSHSSAYLNVLTGQAAAAGGISKTLDEQSPEVRAGLRVLYRTADFPAHPIMAHPRVPVAVRADVRAAFLEMGISETGRVLLAKGTIKNVTSASHKDYEPLKKLGLEEFYVK